MNGKNDLDCSVHCLLCSFATWHRLQERGLVSVSRWNEVQGSAHGAWKQKYRPRFSLLHYGFFDKPSASSLLGQGKYAKVFARGDQAYKVITLKRPCVWELLRCNLKELAFFHSFRHPHLLAVKRSQLVMTHGVMRQIIHEMPLARNTLGDVLYQQRLSNAAVWVKVMRGVASGLQALHARGVLHGDLKPDNVLLFADWESRITDFSLSTFEAKDPTLSPGTLFWRAPACALHRPCGTAADVWAWGVMLLDTMCGCYALYEIFRVRSVTDCFSAWLDLMGPPPQAWVDTHAAPGASPYADALRAWHQDVSQAQEVPDLEARLGPYVRLPLEPAQRRQAWELLRGCLTWEPDQRWTMAQVLAHPLLAFAETKKPSPPPLPPTSLVWGAPAQPAPSPELKAQVTWTTPAEKKQVEEHVLLHARGLTEQDQKEEEEEEEGEVPRWFVHESACLVKRVKQILDERQASYHMDRLVRYCVMVWAFLWLGYDPPSQEVSFSSVVFHVFGLLEFQLFVPVEEIETF